MTTGTTVRMTAAQQTEVRTVLVAELADAHALEARMSLDIADGIESRRGSSGDEVDDPEGSNTAFEGAQTTALLGQARRHAEEVSAALARLDAGTYGECVSCGVDIAEGRLEARPATAFCIRCAA